MIEPGEFHEETAEFVIPREIKSALICTYIHNPKCPKDPPGWGANSFVDINAAENNGD